MCQGNLKELCNPLSLPLLSSSLSQRRIGEPKPSGVRVRQFHFRFAWQKVTRASCQACHFWDKYDFLSGQFYEGHSKRLVYSGNSLADGAMQQLLLLHYYQQLALKFSSQVYKRDSVFIWVCYSAGQIHRWPLTLTFCITPSQSPAHRQG